MIFQEWNDVYLIRIIAVCTRYISERDVMKRDTSTKVVQVYIFKCNDKKSEHSSCTYH